MKKKKRKEEIEDEYIEEPEEREEDEIIADEDIFLGIEGLNTAGEKYYIYRQLPDKSEAFVGEVISPYSVSDLKNDFGGGIYFIYARDGNRIKHRKKIIIAGEPKTETKKESSSNIILNQNDNLDNIIKIIEIMNKINENKQNNNEMMINMLSSISTAISQLSATMLNVMTENIKAMAELQKERVGATTMDVINTTIQEAGNIISQYLELKGLKTTKLISQKSSVKLDNENKNDNIFNMKEKTDITQLNLIDLLNDGQEKNDKDFEFYYKYIKKYIPNFLKLLKEIDLNIILDELQKYNLKIINRDWINELYKYLLDKSE